MTQPHRGSSERLTEWWMPVNAHPCAVRFRSVGETRPVAPSEAACLLPIFALGELMSWPNDFVAKREDAAHITTLTFPA